jgi:hypothetical protein
LTIKFTRSTSCQFSVASSQLEPELEPAMLFEVVRTWMTENARLTTVRRRKAEVARDVATQCLPNLFSYEISSDDGIPRLRSGFRLAAQTPRNASSYEASSSGSLRILHLAISTWHLALQGLTKC